MPTRWQLPLICSAFLCGVICADLFSLSRTAVLAVGIFLIIVSVKSRFQSLALLFVVSFLCGCTVFNFLYSKKVSHWIDSGKLIEMQGRIYAKEKSISGYRLKIISTEQKVYAYTNFTTANAGDFVHVACVQQMPEERRYLLYLLSQGMSGICYDARISPVADELEFRQAPFLFIRLAISHRIKQLWSNPVSALVAGLLLGTREDFPQRVLDDFRKAGVTHIIALSGFNISILIVFFELILVHLLVPKRARLPVILIGITLFTIFVGAAASITRAAFMGSIALTGKYVARQVSVLRIGLLTAAVMVFFNPLILLYDLGFQLSFLATIGLVSTAEWFDEKLAILPNIFELRTSLATTLAASLPTTPLLIWQFEALSIISPAANVLVLPFIPLIMAAGACVVGVSFFSPELAGLFVIPVAQMSRFVLSISSFSASFPWAYSEISQGRTLLCAGSIVLFIAILYDKYRQNRPLHSDRGMDSGNASASTSRFHASA